MSTRQNKKRKGRNNQITRERTVTTLTDGPDTPFLTEVPPGIMTSPFSTSNQNNPNYTPNFGFGSFNGFMGNPMHAEQPFFPPPQIILPPGENDLEILEKLKDMIKNGQHEFYRAIPQPRALASLYLGPNAPAHPHGQVSHHPEQAPQDHEGPSQAPSSPIDQSRSRPPRIQNKDARPSISVSATNNGLQKQDSLGPPPSTGMSVDTNDSKTSESTRTTEQPRPLSDRLGPYGDTSSPHKTFVDDRPGWRDTARPSSPDDRRGRDVDRRSLPPPARNGSTAPPSERLPTRDTRDQRYYDGRDREYDRDTRDRDRDRDLLRDRDRDRDWDGRERDWDRDRDRRDRFVRDERRMSDVRRPPPDQRHYEPSYDRGFPPPRRYDPPSRSSTAEDVLSGNRSGDGRPPPASPADTRTMKPPANDDAPRRSLDDRISGRDPPARGPPSGANDHLRRPSTTDDRRSVVPASPSSTFRVPPPSGARASSVAATAGRPAATDDRTSRASSSLPPPADDRTTRPVPLEERIGRPSLQDRLSQPPRQEDNRPTRQASLEERLSHPSTTSTDDTSSPVRASASVTAPASTPDTRSARPTASTDQGADRDHDRDRSRPSTGGTRPADERSVAAPTATSRPPLEDRDRPPVRTPPIGRPGGDRYPPRPLTPDRGRAPPPLSRPAGFTADSHRAPSVLRDSDPRGTRAPPSRLSHSPPPPSSRTTDLRDRGPLPSRDHSLPPPPRDNKPDFRANNYRPDESRYADDRRSDAMDVDPPSRYSDTRNSYPPRRFSPPSAADLARDRERARGMYPPPSPPPLSSRGPPPLSSYDDADRGRLAGERRDWHYGSDYPERRRDYDDDYWKYSGSARGVPPPLSSDRDRYDRDLPPPPPPRSQAWDPRDDRDRDRRPLRADTSPSRPSYDPPPPRALGSRLADSYPPPPSSADRSYAPPPPPPSLASSARDLDRRYPPPPPSSVRASSPASYSRVRPRSPSPIGRRPPPPAADDMRPPPPKRQRDDTYPPDYYTSRDPPPPPPRRADNYPPPRISSPPPPSTSSSGYYDRAPPASAASVDRDRDRGRDSYVATRDYGRPAYERPRSPPPRAGAGGATYSRPAPSTYSRPVDPRDDRRYMPPPPPRTA